MSRRRSPAEGMFEMSMKVEIDSLKEANTAFEALRVDDDDYIITSLSGKALTAHVRAGSLDGLKRAADDWMACLIAVVKGPRSKGPGPGS